MKAFTAYISPKTRSICYKMATWSSLTKKTILAINSFIKLSVANASLQFDLDKGTLLSRKWTAGLESKPTTKFGLTAVMSLKLQ